MHVGVDREQREAQQQEVQQRLAQPALEGRNDGTLRPGLRDRILLVRDDAYRNFTHSTNNSYGFAGVYHTGDVQARCWTVAATFGFGGRFSLAAQ